jgi:hypothetical protein
MRPRIFLIIFITFVFRIGLAQSNEKAFADTTLWHMYSYYSWVSGSGGNPEEEHFHNYNITFSDTTIDDITYQILYSCNSDFEINSIDQIGYFMKNEDLVYFGESIDSMEIMYDYNLNIGDTFEFKALNSFYPEIFNVEVVSVDSIFFNDSYRKRIQFEEFPFTALDETISVTWTEGIGDYNYGIVFDYGLILFCESFGTSNISCFNENNIPLIGNCQINMDVPSIVSRQYLSISPNPFTDYIKIIGLEDRQVKIDLFNINGQLLVSRTTRVNELIDFSAIQPGFYILSINYKNKIYVKKLIKNWY